MIVRRSGERGQADHGWLRSAHTFSFADYYDPAHMGYRALRVINEDHVAPGRGFGTHPHRDMEILTYVLDGAVSHRDSMGNHGLVLPGEVQRMTAGTGVTHSEVNGSDDPLHLLQIWILPERPGLTPSYEQNAYPAGERQGRLRILASRDGRDGSVTLHQDASVHGALLAEGERVSHVVAPGRHAWIQVARGAVTVGGVDLGAGDGAAIDEAGTVELVGRGAENAEILLFDLA